MQKILNEDLGRKSVAEFKGSEKKRVVLVLDNVRSLSNIGSAFRTADAFLIEKIYLCGISGTPPNKDIHKTALGAEMSIEWRYFKTTMEAVESIRNEKEVVTKIVAIEQVENAISLENVKHNQKDRVALIFGNEVRGVDQEVIDNSDYAVEIPQDGTKHSFNVAVSIGIVLWKFIRG